MTDWRRAFRAVLIAEVLAVVGFNACGPIIPLYIQFLGVTDPVAVKVWTGANTAVCAILLSAFAPIWGKLADSVGKRAMLLRAMIGGGIVMALMGVVFHPWQFLVLRGMQGILAGTVAAATVYVATISPQDQMGYTLGLLQTGIYAGASFGPALGGFLADLLGLRVDFFLCGALLLLAAFIVIRYVPIDPPTHSWAGGSIWKRILPDFSPLAGSRALLSLILISGALQVANTTVSTILPLYIQQLTPDASRVGTITGLILGLSALCAALSAAALGRVSARLGYERLLVVCLTGAFLVFIPQGLVHNPWLLMVFRMAGGAMVGGSEPSLNAMIAIRTPKPRQGAVFGLTSSLNNAGATIGPVIGAGVSIPFGYPAAFFSGALILLAGSIAARTLHKTRQTSS